MARRMSLNNFDAVRHGGWGDGTEIGRAAEVGQEPQLRTTAAQKPAGFNKYIQLLVRAEILVLPSRLFLSRSCATVT